MIINVTDRRKSVILPSNSKHAFIASSLHSAISKGNQFSNGRGCYILIDLEGCTDSMPTLNFLRSIMKQSDN